MDSPPDPLPSFDGLLLVDKPSGPTSHDIVGRVRRRLPRGTRVGHAGTLDPFATGLLIVLVGRATRIQRLVLGLPKTYVTTARLGWTSDTGDRDGTLVPTGRIPPDPPQLPTGRIRQRPPSYSAVKVGGRRAYQLARAGETVELPEREVEVSRFEQVGRHGDRAEFAISCSSGTYVRTLISDLGDAYCEELRRLTIGPFALPVEGPEQRLGLVDALERLVPIVALDADGARRLGHGQRPPAPPAAVAAGEVLCLDAAGRPIALAEEHEGLLVARVGFTA